MRAERRHPNCLNCGAPTPGEFCAVCGQRNADLHASFWELITDLLGEAFEADSRIGRTIVPFLFKPGFLTAEHNAGRRVRYSSPLRLYLFCSFGFFLALSLASRGGLRVGEGRGGMHVGFGGDSQARDGGTADAGPQDAGPSGLQAALVVDDDDEAPDAGRSARDGGPDDIRVSGLGPFNQRIESRVRELKQMDPAKREQWKERFADEFFGDLPKAVFLLLPIFALLLKLLFWRTRRFYVEHLTFAFHVHAFAFLAMLPAELGGRPWTALLAAVVIPVYFVKALRTVYGQGWGWTLAKSAALAFVYFLFVGAAISVVGVIGLLVA